jgi:hypothetical protein
VTENGEKIPRFDALAIRLPSPVAFFLQRTRPGKTADHTLLSGVESGVRHLTYFLTHYNPLACFTIGVKGCSFQKASGKTAYLFHPDANTGNALFTFSGDEIV